MLYHFLHIVHTLSQFQHRIFQQVIDKVGVNHLIDHFRYACDSLSCIFGRRSAMIDSLMFGIPVDENVSVMKLSTGSLESYLSKRIFPTEILIFKGVKSFPDVIAEYNDLYR